MASFLGGLLDFPGALLGPNAGSDERLALAAGLLNGRGNVLANLGGGLLGAQSARQQRVQMERANRANDLQQLTSSYKILQQQDQQQALADALEGRPHERSPLLAQHEQKLGQLLGLPSLSGQPGVFGPAQSQPTGLLSGPPVANTPPQTSLLPAPANAGPAPQGAMPAPMPGIGGPAQQQQPSIPELLKGAGIDTRMAILWSQTPEGRNQLFKQLATVYGPHLSNGVMMQLNPNGSTRFLGGTVTGNAVPVTSDAAGNLQLRPVPGAIGYQAQREGAITSAQEAAKAQRDLVPIPQPDGTVRYMSRSQAIGMTGQGGMQFPGTDANGNIPPDVQAQRDGQRMAILQQERSRQLAQTGRVDPALEREIQLAQGGAPGFSAGQSTAAKVAAEVNPKLQLESLAKSYDDNLKAANGLVFLDAARKAVNGATTTGLFSKPALLMARVGSAFGVTDPAAAADPETFLALSARSVMAAIKSLGSGSGISDSDRLYAQEAMGGSLPLNRTTINRLLDIQERATRIMVQQHNRKVEQAAKNGVPSVYDYRIEIPNSSSSGNVVTLPDGRTATFPNAQAAEQFKRAAGF